MARYDHVCIIDTKNYKWTVSRSLKENWVFVTNEILPTDQSDLTSKGHRIPFFRINVFLTPTLSVIMYCEDPYL